MDPPGKVFDVSYRTLSPFIMDEDENWDDDLKEEQEDPQTTSTTSCTLFMPIEPEFPQIHQDSLQERSQQDISYQNSSSIVTPDDELPTEGDDGRYSPDDLAEGAPPAETESLKETLEYPENVLKDIEKNERGSSDFRDPCSEMESQISERSDLVEALAEQQSGDDSENSLFHEKEPVDHVLSERISEKEQRRSPVCMEPTKSEGNMSAGEMEGKANEPQLDNYEPLESNTVTGLDSAYLSSSADPCETQLPTSKSTNPNRFVKNTPLVSADEQPTEPGAYLVTRIKQEGKELVKITVPPNTKPNDLFEVRLGIRHIRLVCPPNARSGSQLSVQVDKEDRFKQIRLKPAILTISPTAQKFFGTKTSGKIGGAYKMLPDLMKAHRDAKQDAASLRTKVIAIPEGAVPGKKFEYKLNGKRYRLLCPLTSKPGDRLRMAIRNKEQSPKAPANTQTISVIIPDGISPGDAFAIQLSSWPSPITITCPTGSQPGDLMDLDLPTDQVLASICVKYPSESWVRTVRFRDLNFQWVRLTGENSSIVDESQMFHFYKSAYCRTVRLMEGNDPRMDTGRVSFVPAAKAVVSSRLVVDSETTVTYADISLLQGSSRIDKHLWFKEMCRKMVKRDDKHIKIAVRRDYLLPDSLSAVMSLDKEDLRRVWEIKFIGEEVRDQGGPMKEWFELVTLNLLDPDAGYFIFSQTSNVAVEINPTSYVLCAGDHLLYYRFLGRLLGRALFCGHLIKGNFTSLFYKFLLGWPINSKDITDAALYNSLCDIARADEVEGQQFTFTATENAFFKKVDHELIKNGLTTFVSTENRELFLERMIRYHLFERTLPQLTEVVLGFFDVVPEPLLTIFDAKELELVLCGLPRIQLDDWQANTAYLGLFSESGPQHQVIQWFWQVVEEYDSELRARLLQFATGSSGVPFLGFQHLRGHDDRPNPFTIEGVPLEACLYPKAHSCFNKIDLPVFRTIEDLREKLTFSITTAFVGFDDE